MWGTEPLWPVSVHNRIPGACNRRRSGGGQQGAEPGGEVGEGSSVGD